MAGRAFELNYTLCWLHIVDANSAASSERAFLAPISGISCTSSLMNVAAPSCLAFRSVSLFLSKEILQGCVLCIGAD